MNQPRTMTILGTRIGWAETSPDSDLLPCIIVTTTNRLEPDQRERFPNAFWGQDRQGALIYQIEADERQLRESIELIPAGAEAEFHVTVEDQGRLRLEGIVRLPKPMRDDDLGRVRPGRESQHHPNPPHKADDSSP